MPGIDGFETLRRLRAGAHRDVPVILVTGHRVDAESVGAGLELGAEEYLQKPVRPAELRARIRALLKLAAARRELEALKRDQTAMLVHDLKQPLAIIALRAEFIEDEEQDGEMKQSAHVDPRRLPADGGADQLGARAVAPRRRADDAGARAAAARRRRRRDRRRDARSRRCAAASRSASQTEALGAAELDRAKIVQVMQNLVGNALKFTPSGGRIDVSVRRSGGEAVVTVEDSGPGFGEAELRRAVRPLASDHATAAPKAAAASASPSPAPSSKPTAAESAPAPASTATRGARFWFTLPLAPAAAALG